MKILLTTLNAKYVHSSLSLLYLEKFCLKYNKEDDVKIIIKEYTINDNMPSIAANIYKVGADIIAFSCYIWNIEMILEIANIIKKVNPQSIIIFGGPEISYDPKEVLSNHSYIDYIIMGEGEQTLSELIKSICSGQLSLEEVLGIAYRDSKKNVIINKCRPLIENLDIIPSPYTLEDIQRLKGKIIYYETSRGCPFNCSYCLSSTIKGVRNFSFERITLDLKFLIDNNIKLIKFVDRTFNCDKKRTKELFEFLYKNKGNTSFHFEIAAHLLDDDIIDYLSGIENNVFQFEIGVQSTNDNTINEVNRQTNFGKVAANVKRLRKFDNIHLHLDLIAGLPYENYNSFEKSFNDVYNLSPHMLQLGFLKLLKGSKIRNQEQNHQYKYISTPPYEVLCNNVISYDEMLKLKALEDVLDKYYNSGVFKKSLEYVMDNFYKHSPFKFYEDIGQYFEKNQLDRLSHSRRTLYNIFYEFYKVEVKEEIEVFAQYLKFDLLYNNKGVKMFPWGEKKYNNNFKDDCYKFLNNDRNIEKYLPQYFGMPVKKIIKNIDFHVFDFDVLDNNISYKHEKEENVILFDYESGAVSNITDRLI